MDILPIYLPVFSLWPEPIIYPVYVVLLRLWPLLIASKNGRDNTTYYPTANTKSIICGYFLLIESASDNFNARAKVVGLGYYLRCNRNSL